jgi:hypothetical protein
MAKQRAVALPGFVEDALDAALDKALRVQRPVVVAYLDRVRARRRDAGPADVIRLLERRYLAAVTAVGAASGGAAAVPGAGTGASLASAALEISAFTEATALFALAMAEVHDLHIDDPQVRRALVLAVLLGDTGVEVAEIAAADAGSRWPQVVARRAPEETIRRVNHALSRHFMTRFGSKQGALALGRALPLGIGAGIGAAGNVALGRGAISAARRMFGPPPAALPPRVIDAEVVADPPR